MVPAGIPSDILERFTRTVRARSDEHWNSLASLLREHNLAVAVGLLRQEIDTFIRLVYLDSVDDDCASQLIRDFLNGENWTREEGGKRVRLRDREMVNIAKQSYFWVEIVYELGCRLIHLSKIHDYRSLDPFTMISPEDKETIIDYLRGYHQYKEHDIDFLRFVRLLPNVMQKIRGKVFEYSQALENRRQTAGT